jgi:phosphate transport system ATP-binding protein
MPPEKHIEVQDLCLYYGAKEVIKGISFDIFRNEIFGVIGPAQSGKTSLLRCVNRTIDFSPDARLSGSIRAMARTCAR